MFERISLNSLKFFYFVAKYGSVTQAAKKLCVTQSAVSKQIYNLEDALHTSLFLRKNKSLYLTIEGERLFLCSHQIFNELDECLIGLQQSNTHKKQLILSCEPTLSMKWLIPRLTQFKNLGYDFDIILLTNGGNIDFEKDQIDLAIRRNDFNWEPHIFSEKLADEYITIIENHHLPKAKNLLISKSRPAFLQYLEKFHPIKNILKTHTHTEFEHFYLCLEACLSGLGASLISMYMVEKEIEMELLSIQIPPFHDHSGYYLLSSQDFADDPRKLIVLNWLKDEMQASQNQFAAKNAR